MGGKTEKLFARRLGKNKLFPREERKRTQDKNRTTAIVQSRPRKTEVNFCCQLTQLTVGCIVTSATRKTGDADEAGPEVVFFVCDGTLVDYWFFNFFMDGFDNDQP